MSLWSLLVLSAFVGATLLLFVAAWRLDREQRRLQRMIRECQRLAAEYGLAMWEE